MPHLTLEYSSNVTQTVDYHGLFKELHHVLADDGGVNLNNCKSRTRPLDVYYVGDGDESHAIVHLEIALLEGRSDEIKSAITGGSLAVLKRHYAEALEKLALQISVELRDIERAPYAKVPEGTLSKI